MMSTYGIRNRALETFEMFYLITWFKFYHREVQCWFVSMSPFQLFYHLSDLLNLCFPKTGNFVKCTVTAAYSTIVTPIPWVTHHLGHPSPGSPFPGSPIPCVNSFISLYYYDDLRYMCIRLELNCMHDLMIFWADYKGIYNHCVIGV